MLFVVVVAAVCRVLYGVSCHSLFVVCVGCLLCVCVLLFVVRRALFVVCWLSEVVCCVSCVVYYLLCVLLRWSLFGMLYMFCVVLLVVSVVVGVCRSLL